MSVEPKNIGKNAGINPNTSTGSASSTPEVKTKQFNDGEIRALFSKTETGSATEEQTLLKDQAQALAQVYAGFLKEQPGQRNFYRTLIKAIADFPEAYQKKFLEAYASTPGGGKLMLPKAREVKISDTPLVTPLEAQIQDLKRVYSSADFVTILKDPSSKKLPYPSDQAAALTDLYQQSKKGLVSTKDLDAAIKGVQARNNLAELGKYIEDPALKARVGAPVSGSLNKPVTAESLNGNSSQKKADNEAKGTPSGRSIQQQAPSAEPEASNYVNGAKATLQDFSAKGTDTLLGTVLKPYKQGIPEEQAVNDQVAALTLLSARYKKGEVTQKEFQSVQQALKNNRYGAEIEKRYNLVNGENGLKRAFNLPADTRLSSIPVPKAPEIPTEKVVDRELAFNQKEVQDYAKLPVSLVVSRFSSLAPNGQAAALTALLADGSPTKPSPEQLKSVLTVLSKQDGKDFTEVERIFNQLNEGKTTLRAVLAKNAVEAPKAQGVSASNVPSTPTTAPKTAKTDQPTPTPSMVGSYANKTPEALIGNLKKTSTYKEPADEPQEAYRNRVEDKVYSLKALLEKGVTPAQRQEIKTILGSEDNIVDYASMLRRYPELFGKSIPEALEATDKPASTPAAAKPATASTTPQKPEAAPVVARPASSKTPLIQEAKDEYAKRSDEKLISKLVRSNHPDRVAYALNELANRTLDGKFDAKQFLSIYNTFGIRSVAPEVKKQFDRLFPERDLAKTLSDIRGLSSSKQPQGAHAGQNQDVSQADQKVSGQAHQQKASAGQKTSNTTKTGEANTEKAATPSETLKPEEALKTITENFEQMMGAPKDSPAEKAAAGNILKAWGSLNFEQREALIDEYSKQPDKKGDLNQLVGFAASKIDTEQANDSPKASNKLNRQSLQEGKKIANAKALKEAGEKVITALDTIRQNVRLLDSYVINPDGKEKAEKEILAAWQSIPVDVQKDFIASAKNDNDLKELIEGVQKVQGTNPKIADGKPSEKPDVLNQEATKIATGLLSKGINTMNMLPAIAEELNKTALTDSEKQQATKIISGAIEAQMKKTAADSVFNLIFKDRTAGAAEISPALSKLSLDDRRALLAQHPGVVDNLKRAYKLTGAGSYNQDEVLLNVLYNNMPDKQIEHLKDIITANLTPQSKQAITNLINRMSGNDFLAFSAAFNPEDSKALANLLDRKGINSKFFISFSEEE